MNEAIKLTQIKPLQMGSKFKDGDDGGDTISNIIINMADNGYILSVVFNETEEIELQEVYNDSNKLLERVTELIKA